MLNLKRSWLQVAAGALLAFPLTLIYAFVCLAAVQQCMSLFLMWWTVPAPCNEVP